MTACVLVAGGCVSCVVADSLQQAPRCALLAASVLCCPVASASSASLSLNTDTCTHTHTYQTLIAEYSAEVGNEGGELLRKHACCPPLP